MAELSRSNSHTVIDEIVFMSSLVSNLSVIDPILEPVKSITARQKPGQPLDLSKEDEDRLAVVRSSLEDYLVRSDPIRSFTRDSLREKLEDQFGQGGGVSPRRRIRRQFRLILAIIAVVYLNALVWLFALSVDYWWLLAASASVTATFLSSCWLFLTGYKTFSAELHKVYTWICVGIVLLGISASSWLLFTSIRDVYNVPFMRYGANYASFALAFVATYIGIRIFAKAVKVRSRLTSWPLVFGVGAFLAVLTTLLPHVSTPEDRYLDTTIAASFLITYLGYIILALTRRIRKVLTPLYARAVSLFGIGYGLSATVGIAGVLLLLATGTGFSIKLVIMGMLYACGGMLVFVSGYLFRLSTAGKSDPVAAAAAPPAGERPQA